VVACLLHLVTDQGHASAGKVRIGFRSARQFFAVSSQAISKTGDPELDQHTKILDKWFSSSGAGKLA
jgi:hypothetical protein